MSLNFKKAFLDNIMFSSLNCRFFRQYFLLLCINQMASALFRFMGALGRNVIVANTFGSFALLAFLVMGGFVLTRGLIFFFFFSSYFDITCLEVLYNTKIMSQIFWFQMM